ncbi:DNA alkylation repair protein [Acinetobacter stercoris]|uniref:DNA alkylation repair enzyme n=1 Tax=Acinetobacter stercoris TaxID=2126983 RepID=A0A2U3MUW0_9GAMM|nr:DNA alkylation repair protein [Acinetobacter stercoris]SPL69211.1 DNA alkylation repair enzyme [Acinetobacter stercoris]
MIQQILANIRNDLNLLGDETVRKTSQRFFKKDQKVNFYGIKNADVKKIIKKYKKPVLILSKKQILELCESLLKTNYIEEAGIAFAFTEMIGEQFEPSDINLFENWINLYINNWATCDTLCNHTIGNFIIQYPELISELKKWTNSSNRWMKRAAAVSLIIPARNGLFLNDIFEIANSLINDSDDMVQKGYGWMLKAASQAHPNEVFLYVLSKKEIMPRTAYRYAIEKLPKEQKEIAMRK